MLVKGVVFDKNGVQVAHIGTGVRHFPHFLHNGHDNTVTPCGLFVIWIDDQKVMGTFIR